MTIKLEFGYNRIGKGLGSQRVELGVRGIHKD